MTNKNKKTITSTGNKRLYQMGPIDAVKLIAYPAPAVSMIEYSQSVKVKKSK